MILSRIMLADSERTLIEVKGFLKGMKASGMPDLPIMWLDALTAAIAVAQDINKQPSETVSFPSFPSKMDESKAASVCVHKNTINWEPHLAGVKKCTDCEMVYNPNRTPKWQKE